MTKLFNALLKFSLYLFFLSFLIGLFLLYSGSNAYTLFGKIGLLSSVVFTTIVIGEVMASENSSFITKFIWISSFLAFQIFAGMAYYFVDRKTIYRAQATTA